MAYQSSSGLAEAVCEYIGWRYAIRPIECMRRGAMIYVTGTLLKPDEWRRLRGKNGTRMTYEGQEYTLRITGVPRLD